MTDVITGLGSAWTHVLTHLWQTTLVLVPMFVLARWLRFAPPRLLHAFWGIGLFKLLVPVSLIAAGIRLVAPETLLPPAMAGTLDGVRVFMDPAAAWSGHSLPSAMTILILAGTALWACGLAWSLVRVGREIRLLRRIGRAAVVTPDGARRARLESALEGTGIPRRSVVITEAPVMPHVAGAWRPRIVVPDRLVDELDPIEMRCVLLHEDAHRRRRDPLRAAVHRVVASAFFFYPLLRPLLRRLDRTAELVCDEAVVRAGVAPKSLARALARTVRYGLEVAPVSAVGEGGGSMLRQRFDRLTEPRRYRVTHVHRALIVLAAAAVVVASCTSGSSEDATTTEPDAAAEMRFDTPPEVLEQVPPKYPEAAREQQITGKVFVRVTIDEAGKVQEAVINRFDPGTELLHDAAREAASAWTFKPASFEGKPVKCQIVVPFNFALN